MINNNYSRLTESYLFADIANKVSVFKKNNPQADIVMLGIGDITLPIIPEAIKAMHRAVDEMAKKETFKGYGPYQGYDFLTNAIIASDYSCTKISADEIFVSEGAKNDVGNFQEIFSSDAVCAITDPVYPVYLDSNIMAGRKIVFMPATEKTDFAPEFPKERVDLIYLCCPNNPTGAALSKSKLQGWVDYAKNNGSVILYDAAYSAYIKDADVPKTIYEIEGARDVAVEFKSFSKTAGFTGVRCAYTVLPKTLMADGVSLHKLWLRRQTTKFNGVSYIVQQAAYATLTPEGKAQTEAQVKYYMKNAEIIRKGLIDAGFKVYGGVNAPYIWWKLPEGVKSMNFLSKLLNSCQVVGTPGVGFGAQGEGYFRLTAFGDNERTKIAIERIKAAKNSLF